MSSEITDTWARIGSMLLSTIKGHASLSESTIARSEGFCCGSQIDHFIQTANFLGFVVGALIAVFFGFAAGAIEIAEAAESAANVYATRITEADAHLISVGFGADIRLRGRLCCVVRYDGRRVRRHTLGYRYGRRQTSVLVERFQDSARVKAWRAADE
jgi:hypothetical protein